MFYYINSTSHHLVDIYVRFNASVTRMCLLNCQSHLNRHHHHNYFHRFHLVEYLGLAAVAKVAQCNALVCIFHSTELWPLHQTRSGCRDLCMKTHPKLCAL